MTPTTSLSQAQSNFVTAVANNQAAQGAAQQATAAANAQQTICNVTLPAQQKADMAAAIQKFYDLQAAQLAAITAANGAAAAQNQAKLDFDAAIEASLQTSAQEQP